MFTSRHFPLQFNKTRDTLLYRRSGSLSGRKSHRHCLLKISFMWKICKIKRSKRSGKTVSIFGRLHEN